MEKYIRTLRIIYSITLAIPLLLIGVFSTAIQKGTVMLNNDMDEVLKYMIPICAVAFISIGFVFFKRGLGKIQIADTLDSKLIKYKQIFIQRIAFIEGVALFSAVAFTITLNNIYVIYSSLISISYFFFYPTIDKINRDLGISETDAIDLQNQSKKPIALLGKSPLIGIAVVVLMIAINYNSFSDYFTNKVVLPQVKVDNGILKDTIYTNQYLGWTIKIPSGYSIIPDSVIEHNEKRGEELIGKMSEVNKPIRLLNITNGDVGFQSTLNPRVLYPQMTSEEVYLARIDQQFQGANLGSVKINKTGQGEIRIGGMQFKYAEYLMIAKSEKRIIFFSKFNKDYMLDISIIYSDSIAGKKMFDRLKESKMNWK